MHKLIYDTQGRCSTAVWQASKKVLGDNGGVAGFGVVGRQNNCGTTYAEMHCRSHGSECKQSRELQGTAHAACPCQINMPDIALRHSLMFGIVKARMAEDGVLSIVKQRWNSSEYVTWTRQRLKQIRAGSRAVTHPHDLALLLKDLQGGQLLHVVLTGAIIQNLLGAVNEAAKAVALAERPPLHVAGSAHPLQCGHTQAQPG